MASFSSSSSSSSSSSLGGLSFNYFGLKETERKETPGIIINLSSASIIGIVCARLHSAIQLGSSERFFISISPPHPPLPPSWPAINQGHWTRGKQSLNQPILSVQSNLGGRVDTRRQTPAVNRSNSAGVWSVTPPASSICHPAPALSRSPRPGSDGPGAGSLSASPPSPQPLPPGPLPLSLPPPLPLPPRPLPLRLPAPLPLPPGPQPLSLPPRLPLPPAPSSESVSRGRLHLDPIHYPPTLAPPHDKSLGIRWDADGGAIGIGGRHELIQPRGDFSN